MRTRLAWSNAYWIAMCLVWVGACAVSTGDPESDAVAAGDQSLHAARPTRHSRAERFRRHLRHHKVRRNCDEPVQCGGIAGLACPGAGQCVDDPSDDCDPTQGGADCGGLCRCVETQLCARGLVFDSSPEVCACVAGPAQDPCAAVRCSAGTHCEADGDTAACLPDEPPVTCGGIAARPCPGLGTCSDDPSDDCDPQNGGADCGGICTCLQNALCVQGLVFDPSPSVCDCVPEEEPSPCALVDCAPGSSCEVHDGAGVCVSDGSLACGDSTCGAGDTCCNASCGICTPPGGACIQLACN